MKPHLYNDDMKMCFELGFYTKNGAINVTLQTKSSKTIVKQLLNMTEKRTIRVYGKNRYKSFKKQSIT